MFESRKRNSMGQVEGKHSAELQLFEPTKYIIIISAHS